MIKIKIKLIYVFKLLFIPLVNCYNKFGIELSTIYKTLSILLKLL